MTTPEDQDDNEADEGGDDDSDEKRNPGDPVLAARLKEMRERTGIKPGPFAKLLGVSRSTVARIENATRGPSIELLRKWHEQCGYTLDGVRVGSPEQAAALAMAAANLPKGELDSVIRIVRTWPRLSERARGRILGIIEADET